MFVNGVAFLIIFSQNIKLLTVEHIPTRTVGQLAKSLMNICKLYAKGGFVVTVVLKDKEFDKIRNEVGLLEVNTTAARVHMARIEHQIGLVKKQTRCTIAALLECGIMYLHIQIVIRWCIMLHYGLTV